MNIFGTIPVIGSTLVEWIRGDYGIADSTLNRFFALHVVAVPLALLLLVVLHLVALRRTGSNNPDGIEIKANLGPDGHPVDGLPFHPYYSVKDSFGISVFLVIFACVVFFAPTLGGYFLEHANFEPTDIFSTPNPITPSWYFTPYYAILRAIPDQRMGALLMALSLVCFLLLPWLDRSPVKSIRYKGPWSKAFLALFTVSFLGLMYLGLQEPAGIYILLGRLCTGGYFTFFILMPFYTRLERCKPVPTRVRLKPMRKLTRARSGVLGAGFAALCLTVVAGLAAAADTSAPAASAPDASAPAAAPGSVQAVMAMAAKVAQQQVADKKKQDEEERLKGFGADWGSWTPDNSVADVASLQRGLRDYAGYCRGCHALKYMRYSRLATDLQITPEQLQNFLLPAGAKPSDYVATPMPPADALTWFGKVPPDLSLMARARGTEHLYRFLTTFYADPSRTTGANNLELPGAAMPHVLSTLEGVKVAVFKTVDKEQVFDHFVQVSPGSLSHEEYLATVRDLVNFLDYAGEPSQVLRRSLGVKVVLFLLAFTALTYLLKREYWKKRPLTLTPGHGDTE